MQANELARSALDSIRAHKLRSFLTLLGIIIGVTTIVGVASVISGLDAYVQEKVIQLSPDVFGVSKFGVIRTREEFLQALRRPDIDFHDFATLASQMELAEAVAADVTTGATVSRGNRHLADVRVHGSTANYGTLANVDVETGRFLSEADETAGIAVAVVGWDVKDELFGGLDPVGREIRIGSGTYRVVGTVAQQGRTLGQSQDDQVWVPIGAFRRQYGRRSSIDLLVKARGGVPGIAAATDEARAILRALRHTPYRDPDPFGIVTVESLQGLWRQISTAAFVLTLLVSGVSLGVGGIVIANIMLVGVVERTREIGVRLAMGARKRDIRRQFLLEAALLSTSGGVAGIALGTLAAAAVQGILSFPARTTPLILAAGLGLSTLVGLVAGYLPARNASNLLVVDALRDET